MSILIKFSFAFLSTIGFAILFDIPKQSIYKSGIAGALSWITFYIVSFIFNSLIAGTFFASVVVGILGELLARYYKKPATVYIIPGIVPLVPGAGMYYTMLALVRNDFYTAVNKGTETFL